jgi:hypothetical protein
MNSNVKKLSDGPALTPAQTTALDAIIAWLDDRSAEPLRTFRGVAGAGKTFLLRQLPIVRPRGRVVWTAPTNKAVKCLREALTADDYKPDCRTIYSLLGLRLEANGEVKELSQPEDPVDLSSYSLVVVDEAFMVNSALMAAIKAAQTTTGVRFLFVGDPYQLPPVKEDRSPVEAIPTLAELNEVMRHDNQILTLATTLRGQMGRAVSNIQLRSDNDNSEGVWKLDRRRFEALILDKAGMGWFSDGTTAKAIAWRNVEVDRLNALIRAKVFPGVEAPFVVGDRVIFTSPARDLDDEPIASTDDEGIVEAVTLEQHPVYPEFRCYSLRIALDTNRVVVARAADPTEAAAWTRKKDDLALLAKANGRLWRNFWDFIEAFHGIRHAYAITAHRAQGSTYENAFVLWSDILLNRNRQEALRCLYVAITRARKRLVLGD